MKDVKLLHGNLDIETTLQLLQYDEEVEKVFNINRAITIGGVVGSQGTEFEFDKLGIYIWSRSTQNVIKQDADTGVLYSYFTGISNEYKRHLLPWRELLVLYNDFMESEEKDEIDSHNPKRDKTSKDRVFWVTFLSTFKTTHEYAPSSNVNLLKVIEYQELANQESFEYEFVDGFSLKFKDLFELADFLENELMMRKVVFIND